MTDAVDDPVDDAVDVGSAAGVTAVVTDGAAALPADLAARRGIGVVPMWLTVDGRPEVEGSRPLEELLAVPGVLTSAPAPGEFAAACTAALAHADAVVVCTVARSMSASHEAARIAAADFGERVVVLDTGSAAGGQALVVLAAAEAAADGASVAGVVERAASVARRVRLIATLPSLDHLVRGGRVPGIAGWAGRRLGINPLFEFRDGVVHRRRPALGPEAATDRMVAAVARSAVPGARLRAIALHACAPDVAEDLHDRLVGLGADDGLVGGFGPVMVVHTGPGLAGIAWWWEPA